LLENVHNFDDDDEDSDSESESKSEEEEEEEKKKEGEKKSCRFDLLVIVWSFPAEIQEKEAL
jgi:hypothetical protein